MLAVPGIDVNAKDSEGQSACNYALSSANDEVLEFLCEAGNEDALVRILLQTILLDLAVIKFFCKHFCH